MKKLALVMLLSPLSMLAHADFGVMGLGTVGVYGSLAVSQGTQNDIQPVDNLKQQYGVNKQPSLKDQSVLGVNASLTPLEWFKVNLDVSAKQRADKTFRPEFREASIENNYGFGLRSKVGVLPLEAFKYSSSQDKRLDLLTTTVSTDIYSQMVFQQYVGGELSYTNAHVVPMTVKLFGGTAKTQYALAQDWVSDIKLQNMIGVNGVAKVGPLTLWGSYLNGNLNTKDELYNQVIDAMHMYEAIYPEISDLANRVSWSKTNAVFGSVGAKYETNKLIVDAEIARSDSYAWNLTTGIKLGKMTPYLAYSGIKTYDQVPDNNVIPYDSMTQALYTVAQSFHDQTKVKQHTESVGLKYQPTNKVAYKVQLNHMRINDGFGVNKVSTEGTTEKDTYYGTVAVDFKF